MTTRSQSPSLAGVLALLGLAISATCWIASGPARGQAAAIGSVLSVLNWLSLRWLVGRMLADDGAIGRAGAALLLVFKMIALSAVVYVLMLRFSVEPVGLALGLGVLFVGPVLGSLRVSARPLADTSTAGAAGEER